MPKPDLSKQRFTVFGVRSDLFVELSTDKFKDAVLMHDMTSCEGFKARVFDHWHQGFVTPAVLNMALGSYH